MMTPEVLVYRTLSLWGMEGKKLGYNMHDACFIVKSRSHQVTNNTGFPNCEE